MGLGIHSRNRVWNWAAKLHRVAVRYDNPMSTRFSVPPIAGLKFRSLSKSEISEDYYYVVVQKTRPACYTSAGHFMFNIIRKFFYKYIVYNRLVNNNIAKNFNVELLRTKLMLLLKISSWCVLSCCFVSRMSCSGALTVQSWVRGTPCTDLGSILSRSRNLKSRCGARNRFQEASLALSSQAT